MTALPPVSIVVAVLDEARFIERTAAGVAAQDYAGELEILFVDGGSRDGTLEHLEALARGDPRVRVLRNPRRTQVAALNTGLRAAAGDVIVQMDAHTFYPPAYVTNAVARLVRDDAGWISGPPVPRGVDPGSRCVATALGSRFATGGADKWRSRADGGELKLDTGVFGGAWWKATLEELGGWDERWIVNHDAELTARHIGAGGRIVCLPELAAEYVPRSSLSGLWRQYRGYGYYRVATCKRHPDSMRPSHVVSIVPAATALAALLPGPLGRLARAGLAGYAAAALAVSARLSRLDRPRETLTLPFVFGAIHFSWGFGFIAGCRAFGVPWAAFGSVRRRLSDRLSARPPWP